MATVIRKQDNGILCSTSKPTLGAAFSDTTGTSITFAAALKLNDGSTNVPTLGTDEYRVLVVDPDTSSEEVMYLTAYTAGATTGTVVRNAEGQGAKTHANGAPVAFGSTAKHFDGKDGGLGLIGLTVVSASHDYSTASATLVAVDTTNMVVSFVAPPSGKVLIRLSALWAPSGSFGEWALKNHSGGAAMGATHDVGSNQSHPSVPIVVTGLTAGTTYQADWYFDSASGTAHIYTGGFGGVNGDAVMEVWAVNL